VTGSTAAGRERLRALRPLRHALLTTGIVLAVCGVLAGVAATTFAATSAYIGAATGRAEGVVDAVDGSAVQLRWTHPDWPSGSTSSR